MSQSTGGPPEKRDDDVVAAAEYALGLTTAPDRGRVAERAARDEDFAREVAYWQWQAALMARDTESAVPPERVWRAVQERIAGARNRDENASVISMVPPRRPSGVWRWATMAASGIAAAAVIALTVVLTSPEPEPLIATLQSQQGLDFVLVVQPDRNRIVARAIGNEDSQGRVPELWLLAPADKPIGIGVIGHGEQGTPLTIPARYADQIRAGARFAISLEPQGGSPTGAPTGPVIASGQLSRL
jgi:anti-sigma-K factor RskA